MNRLKKKRQDKGRKRRTSHDAAAKCARGGIASKY